MKDETEKERRTQETQKINCTEKPWDLRERSVQFAMLVMKLCSFIPDNPSGRLIRNQVIRSGTSPGTHYRESQRARSTAEFISKMEGALQELDETDYWLELLDRSDLVPPATVSSVKHETRELIAIFTAAVVTAKRNRRTNKE